MSYGWKSIRRSSINGIDAPNPDRSPKSKYKNTMELFVSVHELFNHLL